MCGGCAPNDASPGGERLCMTAPRCDCLGCSEPVWIPGQICGICACWEEMHKARKRRKTDDRNVSVELPCEPLVLKSREEVEAAAAHGTEPMPTLRREGEIRWASSAKREKKLPD